jgi:hypothetical protein
MYQIISDTHIRRLSDGGAFEKLQGNMDYEKYLKWEAEGNTPEPAPEPRWRLAAPRCGSGSKLAAKP